MKKTTADYSPSAEELLKVMEKLRSKDGGCPWDQKQTHQSLKLYLAEECAELMDAIDNDDTDAICEELGDVMMNLVFHCVIAQEQGRFHFHDALRGIIDKMIRRHPHVFADAQVTSADDVVTAWEKIKQSEKSDDTAPNSILDRIPRNLSAMLTARDIQKRVAKVGFDWSSQQEIIDKIEEELAELKHAISTGDETHADEELGDLMFAVVNLSRFRNRATPEDILQAANNKFKRRFQYIEQQLKQNGKSIHDSCLTEMEAFWQKAKENEPQKLK
jgi:tetrapyrrole methylase family protein/MazG family protein